ncbi:Hypothetical predicted protein [Cloeon dipterum]|uniref:Protein AATF n=2 Tax=Cloeon dipterum TaxID=197152 RepID=A0A8S1CZ23_9INSE|nr:Hypothetical predicted protein [Cloeon dipterum]
MSSKKPALAEEFASLIQPHDIAPDPEDDAEEATRAKLVDTYDDEPQEEQQASVLRRQTVSFDDKRYAGRKISRKDLNRSDDEDESLESSADEDEGASSSDAEEIADGERDESEDDQADEVDEEEEDESSDSDDDSEEYDDADGDMFPQTEKEKSDKEGDTKFPHFSTSDPKSEVKKGNAVKNQLMLWENLLEIRIQMQKTLKFANQMPIAENFRKFADEGGKEFKSAQLKCINGTTKLLDSLIELQVTLFKQNPETKSLSSKESAKEDDEEIPSSEDEAGKPEESPAEMMPPKKKMRIEDYESSIGCVHNNFLSYRNSTIQKWSEKTRMSQGKFNSKNFSAFEQSALKQIEHILADKNRLLKRTRVQRSNYRILGSESGDDEEKVDDEKSQQTCNEIFDDDDFYHQLIRELIEQRSESVTDPVQLGRQWIALQKLRSKMKRKIDTRATKGRKIRYTVIPKLVNFMAPVEHSEWTDEAKNELFASLFAG